MREVKVNTGTPYGVLISRSIFDMCGSITAKSLGLSCRAVIITDKNVSNLYLWRVMKSFSSAGFSPVSYVFEGGEETKNMQTVEEILAFLEKNEITRSDLLVALGGGIVGDVCGFAASIYLRGVRFIQIPTTLLAAVDSSVGGKTGVNFGGLKNQIGTFCQPSLVICDPDTFDTLSDKIYADGMAEVIKYGVISAPDIIETLSGPFDICDIIARCVGIKADIVSRDERDNGVRQLLNYGHTVGHAIEKCSDYSVTHGSAVAIGMVVAARSAYAAGICEEDFTEELESLLSSHGLPSKTDIPDADLLSAIAHDKKRGGDNINLVLPKSLGDCRIYKLKLDSLGTFLKFREETK